MWGKLHIFTYKASFKQLIIYQISMAKCLVGLYLPIFRFSSGARMYGGGGTLAVSSCEVPSPQVWKRASFKSINNAIDNSI